MSKALTALLTVTFCWGCGSGGKAAQPGAASAGTTSNGGGDGGSGDGGSGDGMAGSSGNTATGGDAAVGGTGSVADVTQCRALVPAASGEVRSLFAPSGSSNEVTDVAANCDGSFAAAGIFRGPIGFEQADGMVLSAAGADSPDNPLWVASFDAGGGARFVRGIETGMGDGSGVLPHLASFTDGSVTMAGTFGTSARFGVGEAHETTLTAMSNHPEGYIAHFAAKGEFQWAQQLGPGSDTYVTALSPGRNGQAYAFVVSTHGYVVGPGKLDLALAPGEGALVALSGSGQFEHGVRFSSEVRDEVQITALADGGVALLATYEGDATFGVGGPNETKLSTPIPALVFARFSESLELEWVRKDLPVATPRAATVSADGSLLVAAALTTTDLTLGQGEPNAVTFSNADAGQDAVLARYAPDGSLAWATQVASTTGVQVSPFVSLADGSAWAALDYMSLETEPVDPLVIAPGTMHELSIDTVGDRGAMLRLSPEGEPLWGARLAGDEYLQISALAATGSSLVVGGAFTGTLSFGMPEKTLSATADPGRYSAFLMELGP